MGDLSILDKYGLVAKAKIMPSKWVNLDLPLSLVPGDCELFFECHPPTSKEFFAPFIVLNLQVEPEPGRLNVRKLEHSR